MTTLAVVAYPRLDAADRRWIDAIRAQHDPQAPLIDPHVTLVFPLVIAPELLDSQIQIAAVEFAPIRLTFDRLEAVRDQLASGSHLFLVPSQGREDVALLHTGLYDGALRTYLRSDIPFQPHMTIGASTSHEECARWADTYRLAGRVIHGTIDCVCLIEVTAPRVRTLATIALGRGD